MAFWAQWPVTRSYATLEKGYGSRGRLWPEQPYKAQSVDGLEGSPYVVNKPGAAYQQAPLCSHCSRNMADSLVMRVQQQQKVAGTVLGQKVTGLLEVVLNVLVFLCLLYQARRRK